ncbi:hypothetical protein DMP23_36425 [Amycolatopsis sp. A1MSW2902]|uniref:hypothetical protein n=1 Tax=Amycolatopsis sp. A1MSW2902 TaxID=687413 RepID=UPI00307EE4C0
MPGEPGWIREGLSTPRFAPYLAKAEGDLARACALYWWNVEVSAAFYPSLHCLELALRNGLHRTLATAFDREDWWRVAPLRPDGVGKLAEALRKLTVRGRPQTPDDLVANLSLGFWVSTLSSAYDRTLWVPHLHRTFAFYRGKRRDLHTDLRTVLLFRNRIMHHEPIHHRHLWKDHETILRVLGYLVPELAGELKAYDRVPELLRQRPSR